MHQNWTGKLGLTLCIYPNNAQHHEELESILLFQQHILPYILLISKIVEKQNTIAISPDLAVVKLMLYLIL